MGAAPAGRRTFVLAGGLRKQQRRSAADNDADGRGTATATRTATRTAVPHPSPTVSRTATPPATTTPTQSSAVTGLVVVNRTVMSGPGDVLGVPPPEWSGDPSKAAFDRSLSDADWSVTGVDKQGVTGPDGRFSVSGLSPGKYTFQLTKTLDGNLANMSFPFTVGDDGTADVVAEVAWGLARSVSTYTRAGVQLQETDGPYGTWLITQDGHVRELGDPSRSFVDTDGDGQLEPTPCFENVTTCKTDAECGADRFCRCAEGCPTCPLVCNPGVCVPFGARRPTTVLKAVGVAAPASVACVYRAAQRVTTARAAYAYVEPPSGGSFFCPRPVLARRRRRANCTNWACFRRQKAL